MTRLEELGYTPEEILEIQFLDLEVEVIIAHVEVDSLCQREHETSIATLEKGQKMAWAIFVGAMILGASAPWVIPNLIPAPVETPEEVNKEPACSYIDFDMGNC